MPTPSPNGSGSVGGGRPRSSARAPLCSLSVHTCSAAQRDQGRLRREERRPPVGTARSKRPRSHGLRDACLRWLQRHARARCLRLAAGGGCCCEEAGWPSSRGRNRRRRRRGGTRQGGPTFVLLLRPGGSLRPAAARRLQAGKGPAAGSWWLVLIRETPGPEGSWKMATPGYPHPQPGFPAGSPPYPVPAPHPVPSAPGFNVYPPTSPGAGHVIPPQPPPRAYWDHATAPHHAQQAVDPHAAITPYMPVATNIPPGLEYLAQVDQVLIHQKVELVEAFIAFETNNKYEVRNSMGQPIFHALEQNDCCTRNCCGSLRRFSMRLEDPTGREVLRMVRPLKCVSCWFPCCLQELEVQSPPGTTIGYVVQTWHPFTPKFSIQNVEKETVLRVLGPCFACSCGGDVNFEVKTRDESRGVGRISKQWSGLLKEVFTDTDNFGIQFPMDLDVKIKAVLLGACFLIDFMFFEKTGDVGQRSSVITS
uniref:Phospholipid scramblase n=1 Tax=Salvator merianae TaxID=96440 RepID=A0A8D0B6J8_SALMN